MEYSVGSVSDLITGSNTPNKQKVIKKQVKSVKSEEFSFSGNSGTWSETNTEVVVSVKKRQKKQNQIPDPEDTKPKKRVLDNDADNKPPSKKKKTLTNAERRIHDKDKIKKVLEDPESLARTVFVGNLPITTNQKQFKKLVSKFGQVDSVRIRGAPVADLQTPKKVAIIKKEFHPERKSFYGFARFVNREDAVKATEANGMVFEDHHLRIHLCDRKEKPDENKAIFVGNLSFYAEEDDLWKLFEPCGRIDSVRIVRDNKTGIGKGFGYVNFVNSDSVPLALEMENVSLRNRELRISISNINAVKKNKKKNKVTKITKPGKPKAKKYVSKVNGADNSFEKLPGEDNKVVKIKNEAFQGVKFMEKKKKNKINKGFLKKKKLIKQVAPK